MKNKFTLIELIVGTVIIAILLAIITTNVGNVQAEAKLRKMELNEKQMQTAVDRYFLDNNYYPSIIQPTTDTPAVVDVSKVAPKYIKDSKEEFEYTVDKNGEVALVGKETDTNIEPVVDTGNEQGVIIPLMQIEAGDRVSMFLLNDGTLKSTGNNAYGALGVDETVNTRRSPVKIEGISNVKYISVGNQHSLALLNDGRVMSWGYNEHGELGDGTIITRSTPQLIPGLTDVASVIAGEYHSIAIMKDGTVKSWGWNLYSRLGISPSSDTAHSTPVTIPGLTNVKQIAIGSKHNLALLNDGTVKGWGYNYPSLLGDGTNTERYIPTTIAGLSGVKSVAAGSYHSVALMNDGTVKTWGDGDLGRLGHGDLVKQPYPKTVAGLSNVVDVQAGTSHTVALLSDGTVRAWGYNSFGQIGNGAVIVPADAPKEVSPVPVVGLSNVLSITVGSYHNFALLKDGNVKAWGYNGSGQLGDGSDPFSNRYVSTPVNVTGIVD